MSSILAGGAIKKAVLFAQSFFFFTQTELNGYMNPTHLRNHRFRMGPRNHNTGLARMNKSLLRISREFDSRRGCHKKAVLFAQSFFIQIRKDRYHPPDCQTIKKADAPETHPLF